MFNPDELLTSVFEGANSTSSAPIPEGEYNATCSKVEIRSWQSKTDPNKGGYILSTTWEINDDISESTGRDRNSARYEIFLDITPEGKLDMGRGKNTRLGKLREAVGLNQPGQSFSFTMIEGQSANIYVAHRISGEDVYAEIKSVSSL